MGRAHPGWWFAGESDAASALELLAGLALIGAGAAAWRRRPASRFGPLLWLAGLAWFAPEWNNPAIGSAPAFTAGLLLLRPARRWWRTPRSPTPAAGFARPPSARSWAWPTWRRSACSALSPSSCSTPLLRAARSARETCSSSPPRASSRRASSAGPATRAALGCAGPWARRVAAHAQLRRGAATARTGARTGRRVSRGRRLGLRAQRRQGLPRQRLLRSALWIAEGLALCLLAVGATWEWVRSRRTRSALAALVVELELADAPDGLRAALAHRLGDPSLELLHRLPDGRLVDVAGLHRAPSPDQQLTPLVSGGRTLAVVAHRPGLFADPALAEEVASAARLALDNDRLHAELRAQTRGACAPRALASSRPATPNAGGSSATSTTEPSSGLWRWRCRSASRSLSSDGHDPRARARPAGAEGAARRPSRARTRDLPGGPRRGGPRRRRRGTGGELAVPLRLDGPLPEDRFEPPVESGRLPGRPRDGARRAPPLDVRRREPRGRPARTGGGGRRRAARRARPPRGPSRRRRRRGSELERPTVGVTRLRAELPCA